MKITTMGRVQAAGRITWGHYYVTEPQPGNGFSVFDDRNPDGRALIADEMSFDDAVKLAHEHWLAEHFGQGRSGAPKDIEPQKG